jgi:clan AA aspartic protease (TIGR02281 family)
VVADLAVRASSDHIYVDADVNGEPVTMILDTGADNTTLSPQAAKRLGLEQTNWPGTTVVGIGGAQKAAHFQADGLRIGMLHGRTWDFMVADFGGESLEPRPDGLLGADLLRDYDVDLDLPGGHVRAFYPQHDCSQPSAYLTGPLHMVDLEATTRPGIPISLSTLSLVKLHVKIEDQSLVAEIDSGAPNNVLFLPGLAKLKWATSKLAADKLGLIAGIGPSAVQTVYHTIPTMQIGGVRLENVPVNVVNTSMGPVGPDMIIGLELLRRIHVWISHSSAKGLSGIN